MKNLSDHQIREMLENARVIAVVGHSDKPERTSYKIANYLRRAGYKVYPVNPTVEEINGEKSYPALADVPEPVDIVNIFRRSEFLDGVADEAIKAGAKNFWAQLGLYDQAAGKKARRAGLGVVMNRCIKVEHQRLIGINHSIV